MSTSSKMNSANNLSVINSHDTEHPFRLLIWL